MIRKLLYILSALVAWLENRQDQKRQRKAQESRDELEQDYRAWFAHHFSDGLPDDPDAERTDKADPGDDTR